MPRQQQGGSGPPPLRQRMTRNRLMEHHATPPNETGGRSHIHRDMIFCPTPNYNQPFSVYNSSPRGAFFPPSAGILPGMVYASPRAFQGYNVPTMQQLPFRMDLHPLNTPNHLLMPTAGAILRPNDTPDISVHSPETVPTNTGQPQYIRYKNLQTPFVAEFVQCPKLPCFYVCVRWLRNEEEIVLYSMFSPDVKDKFVRSVVAEMCDDLISYEEGRFPPCARHSLPFLQTLGIYPIEEDVLKYPGMFLFCKICNYHMRSIQHAKTHIFSSTHLPDAEKSKRRQELIERIPSPTNEHISAVTKAAMVLLKEYTNTPYVAEDDIVVEELLATFKLKLKLPENCNPQLILFGSQLVGSALPDSDVNLMLNFDDSFTAEDYSVYVDDLVAAIKFYLTSSGERSDVDVLGTGQPIFAFEAKGRQYRISWLKWNDLRVSRLLSLYTRKLPYAAHLIKLVKHWAKLCEFAKSDFPSLLFDFMVIHYLQRCVSAETEMRLPFIQQEMCIGESFTEEYMKTSFLRRDDEYEKFKSEIQPANSTGYKPNLGMDFVKFFRYFLKYRGGPVSIHIQEVPSTKMSEKYLYVLHPFTYENMVHTTKSALIHFFNCLLQTFLYLVIPQSREGPVLNIGLYQDSETPKPKKKSKKKTRGKPTPIKAGATPIAARTAHSAVNANEPKEANAVRSLTVAVESLTISDDVKTEPASAPVEEFVLPPPETPNETITENVVAVNCVFTESKMLNEAEEIARKEGKPEDQSLLEFRIGGVEKALSASAKNKKKGKRKKNNCSLPEVIEMPVDVPICSEEIAFDVPSCSEQVLSEVYIPKQLDVDGIDVTASVSQGEDDILTTLLNGSMQLNGLFPTTLNDAIIRSLRRKLLRLGFEDVHDDRYCYSREDIIQIRDSIPQEILSKVMESISDRNVELMNNEARRRIPKTTLKSTRLSRTSNNINNNTPKVTPVKIRVSDAISSVLAQSLESPIYDSPLPPVVNQIETPTTYNSEGSMVFPSSPALTQDIDAETGTPSLLEEETVGVGFDAERPNREEFLITFPEETDIEGELVRRSASIPSEDYYYDISLKCNFTGGYKMDEKCLNCDGNHSTSVCPDMQIPELVDYPPRDKKVLEILSTFISSYYNFKRITDSRRNDIEDLVETMEKALKMYTRSTFDFTQSSLTIFGSIENGFGVMSSDVDLCFRFNGHKSAPEEFQSVDVIKAIGDCFRRLNILRDVNTILTAKVPIVKFATNNRNHKNYHNNVVAEGDVSYYNCLALHNTRLLKTYANWDSRVAPLGLWVKFWAKSCEIGDASKGSLSSYSYIILLIHFLQRCDPPILPFLQEKDDQRPKEKVVDGWNVYFCIPKNLEKTQKIWTRKQGRKNQKNLSQLFLEFLDFYSAFNFEKLVVQIRKRDEMPKYQKNWNRPLCLEDPFDLNHNLGSGVKIRMAYYIRKTFVKSRTIFNTSSMMSPDVLKRVNTSSPNEVHSFVERAFWACRPGEPPRDNLCRICSRVGHVAEFCPERRNAGKERYYRRN